LADNSMTNEADSKHIIGCGFDVDGFLYAVEWQ
jgi:hypothetical protein